MMTSVDNQTMTSVDFNAHIQGDSLRRQHNPFCVFYEIGCRSTHASLRVLVRNLHSADVSPRYQEKVKG